MTPALGLLLLLLLPHVGCHATDGNACDAASSTCDLPGCTKYDGRPFEFRAAAERVTALVGRTPIRDTCARQMLTFADALANSSLWAVQMLDASAKLSNAMRSSGSHHPGHFDECVRVNLRRRRGNLYGRYCLADVEVSWGDDAGDEAAGLRRRRRSRVGVCVPNECSHRDVEEMVRSYYEESVGKDVAVGVRVGEDACSADEVRPETVGATFLRYTVLGLALWIVAVTIVDLLGLDWGTFSGEWHKTAEIFSCHRNLRKLVHVGDEDNVPGIHFVLVVTMWVLFTYQRYHLLLTGPVKNNWKVEENPGVPGLIFDTLIFLCGFLITRALQDEPDMESKRKCFQLCVRKWFRLMPLYVVTIVFYGSAFESIGSGPMWAERIGREARQCRDVWWANLSFINNYISAGRQCITQSWYLAVIVHCSFVTFISVHLKRRKSLVGLGSLGLLVTTTMVLFVWNDYALAETNNRIAPRTPDPEEWLRDSFIKTHNRAPSFLVGAVSALLHHRITRSGDGITRVQVVLISFMFTTFGLVSVMAKYTSYMVDLQSRMIFAATTSLSWSLLIGCLVVATSFCDARLLRVMPTKNLFIPLSRLSYPALLVHGALQLYAVGTMRTPEYVTIPRLVWMGSADVLASYALAALLHLTVEAPAASAFGAVFLSKGDESSDLERFQHNGDGLARN